MAKEWGQITRLPSVETLAELYILEMRDVQPVGPYRMLGSSFGGVVAFEMARQLSKVGERVELLAMLDSFAPGFRTPNSIRGWINHLRGGAAGVIPRKLPSELSDKENWSQLMRSARIDTHRAYKPQPYEGDAVLIRAQEKILFPGYRVDQLFGWEEWIRGRLVVEDVPGDHLGILSPPNVYILADRLRPYLDQDAVGASA